MKRTLVIIMAAAMLLVLLPATALAAGTTWNVDTNAELASAFATAASGDTINISNGDYTLAPTTIANNITVVGESKSGVVIKPSGNTGSSGDARGWMFVSAGATLNLSNVTLDGTGYNIFMGILVRGTLNIEHVDMQHIKYPTYYGFGIFNYGTTTAKDITMSDMGRVGIHTKGPLTVDGFAYAGKGAGDWLDYGIEMGSFDNTTVPYVAKIDNVTISNCKGVASVDGSGSAGIMATTFWYTNYSGAPTVLIDITIDHANLSNCSVGVWTGYPGLNEYSNSLVKNSNFFGNECDLCLCGNAGTATMTVSNNYYDGEPLVWVDPGLVITGIESYSTTPIPQSQDTEVVAGVDPTYTIVIPASVDFGTLVKGTGNITREFDVTAQNVLIEAEAEIHVSVASLTSMKDANGLGSNSLAYTLRNETVPVASGLFATFEGNRTEDGTVTVDTNSILIAGSYKGTMTFAISYE